MFLLPTVALLISLLYFLFSVGDIEQNLSDFFIRFSLLTLITVFVYYGIFQLLKTITKEYQEKAKKQTAESAQKAWQQS